jgi:hypothetical protein
MNYQQWLYAYNQFLQQGWTPQQIVNHIGQPPAQTFGNYLMPGAQATTQSPTPPGVGSGGMDQYMWPLAQLLGSSSEMGTTKPVFDMQMQAARLGMNPAALTSLINQNTRPLNQNLINSVTRATTPSIAKSGLATSPGMSEQIIAEALAPYQQREQQMAQQTVMGGMQIPFQVGAGLGSSYPQLMSQIPYEMYLMSGNASPYQQLGYGGPGGAFAGAGAAGGYGGYPGIP